ncbi:Copper chaperone CopZ [Fodinibius roseus]|uniref:Copper chaperone CopZ n=1 Tax=Fodinibius roseus TaxID=1194090 RepID=A0A1M5G1M4_9BACT|nr:heavy metal-associated domain-containing protein [Fodinibius roseus]SHF97665.1 Copper chaperone CopZ [Fodinibius roseus]
MTTTTTILRSDGLSCPSCVNNIESNLNQTEGISKVKVHFNTGRIEVEHDTETVSEEKLVKVVAQSGYEARVSQF